MAPIPTSPWVETTPSELPAKVRDHFPSGIMNPLAYSRDGETRGRASWYVLRARKGQLWYVYDNRPERWNGLLKHAGKRRRFRTAEAAMRAVDRIEGTAR